MGDVGLMGQPVPGMSWRERRDGAGLAEESGYSCLTVGASWVSAPVVNSPSQNVHGENFVSCNAPGSISRQRPQSCTR